MGKQQLSGIYLKLVSTMDTHFQNYMLNWHIASVVQFIQKLFATDREKTAKFEPLHHDLISDATIRSRDLVQVVLVLQEGLQVVLEVQVEVLVVLQLAVVQLVVALLP